MPDRRNRLAAALLIVLVGCGAPNATASPTSEAVRTTAVDLPPSYLFAPAHIEVSSGATVTWTNHDNFTHTVQVNGQPEVHTLRPGEIAQVTFSAPGDYHYVCTLHTQNMQGDVTVR